MKKIIAAFTIALGVAIPTSAATAADPGLPPLAVPAQSWTGSYIGINGGFSSMAGPSSTYVDLAINAYVPFTAVPPRSTGALFGLHFGYSHQFQSNWVLGFEGELSWANAKTNVAGGLLCSGPPFRGQCGGVSVLTDNASFRTDIKWLASLRGRLGYALSDQLLVYATGGLAFAGADYTAGVNCTGIAPTFCAFGGAPQSILTRHSTTRLGLVVGVGLEYKPARNWTIGADYSYYHFGGQDTAGGSWFVVATGAPAPFFECNVPGQNCAAFTFRSIGIHTARLRLSYLFAQ